MAKLLIVEDEPRMIVGLRDNFEYEGYEVITAEDGPEGLHRALHESPDLVLLDLMIPRISGLDVCLQLKAKRPFLPIIMLSARCQVEDKVAGFELGADDYVTKPFSMCELLARVKAVRRGIRVVPIGKHISCSSSDVEGNTRVSQAECSGKSRINWVKLLRNRLWFRGDTLSHDRLLKQVWRSEQFGTTGPADVAISPLRRSNVFQMTGQTLGHYRILSEIGAGGMGVVYQAYDKRLRRRVALKVLTMGKLADKKARAQLFDEARNASSLNHPNICTIYDIGEADSGIYMVMELIDGQPLSRLISERGLPFEDIIRYGIQIADALTHAHAHGIIHRDLKSSNIVVAADGRAKVLDFGLSRRLEHQQPNGITRQLGLLNGVCVVVGTLQYLAPEVLRGEAADERSDLWSFGVVLYELAAGELPFRGQTAFAVSSAILQQAPIPLPQRIPLGMQSIIERCLAKQPSQRYQRFDEVSYQLGALRCRLLG